MGKNALSFHLRNPCNHEGIEKNIQYTTVAQHLASHLTTGRYFVFAGNILGYVLEKNSIFCIQIKMGIAIEIHKKKNWKNESK